MNCLEIVNLRVSVGGKTLFKGLDMSIPQGAVHAVMGPNGVGKSTLAAVLMGHPSVTVEEGSITYCGQDLLAMDTTARARAGMFLGFQHPVAVPGLKISEYLRSLHTKHHGAALGVKEFRKFIGDLLQDVGLPRTVLARDLNEGFSGGEKKRFELVQLSVISPKLVILDEIDSGLDVDALARVKTIIARASEAGATILIISHYKRLLDLLAPEVVHLLLEGQVVQHGGLELVDAIDKGGYGAFRIGATV